MNRTNGSELEALAQDSAGASLIERLRKGTDHRTECTWPGSDERFFMACLSCDEVQDSQSATAARWIELGLTHDIYNTDDFYSEMTTQCLARAIRKIDAPSERLFRDTDELRRLITPDERSLLASAYIENQGHANPNVKDLNPQTLEVVRLAVRKKDLVALSAFGSCVLAIYLLSMESQPAS